MARRGRTAVLAGVRFGDRIGLRRPHRRVWRETEQALGRADGRNDDLGGYVRAAELQVAHVLWEPGDRDGSVKALRRSNRHRPEGERQGRVHATGLLAIRLVQMRHVGGQ
ncbi:regulatory protein [Streptomyces sp. NBRC 110611]|nr:regulatory protein [Streptomyces sp. NBRC 110611]